MKKLIALAGAIALLSLVACGSEQSTADGTQTAVEGVAAKNTSGFKPLAAGESIQGRFTADFGQGLVEFRSLSKRIADDLGESADRKLATREGDARLAKANKELEGTGMSLDASDISEMAHAMAGRTISDSQVVAINHPAWLIATVKGTDAGGNKLQLTISFDAKTLDRTERPGHVSYEPAGAGWRDERETDDVELVIDAFTPNADDSYAIKGRFIADNLKQRDEDESTLKGPSRAEGHFDFAALAVIKL